MTDSTNQQGAPATLIDPIKIENIRSPSFRTVYSNNLRIVTSPAEIRITFSHITDFIKDGESSYANEDEVCVIIPPAAIRTLLAVIEASLQNHEKLWGALPQVKLTNEQSSKEK